MSTGDIFLEHSARVELQPEADECAAIPRNGAESHEQTAWPAHRGYSPECRKRTRCVGFIHASWRHSNQLR